MARYIDADFVSNGLREVLHRPKSEFPDDFEQAINCLVYAISILKFAPTADVAPVVHGHWVSSAGKFVALDDEGDTKQEACCSVCGDWLTASDEYATRGKYCPNCGAIMDKKKEG